MLRKTWFLAVCIPLLSLASNKTHGVIAESLWRYASPSGATEIAAYSAETLRLFVTGNDGVDVVDVVSGTLIETLLYPAGYHATSVACWNGTLAVAWAADDKQHIGKITFYDVRELVELVTHPAGYLPDMITFTPDGKRLISANEGEPNDDYSFDPEGSVTIISSGEDWQDANVREVRFTKFNPLKKQLIADGVRIFGPNQESSDRIATVAQDLEPEYIAVSADSRKAWVTLQENNAIAKLDIERAEIDRIFPLGQKDYRAQANNEGSATRDTGLDVSNQDGGIHIRNWPIAGMYQPDGIETFHQDGETYLVTANEGDPRDYANYTEAIQIDSLAQQGIRVDQKNPARSLVGNPELANLEISRAAGDVDGDGDLDQLVIFGTRSFSIWRRGTSELELVFDSGSEFEQTIAREAPHLFNIDRKLNSQPDDRSTTRGPEPEYVVVFTIDRRRLAAIGLERTGGVMFYDITDPQSPKFMSYLQPDMDPAERDRAPEGLLFIAADQNPHHKPLLITCNEASGTMTAHALSLKKSD